MSLSEFEVFNDPEERAWAMIWKVAPQMEGSRPPTIEDLEIMAEIGKLRMEGKLNAQQEEMLKKTSLNVLFDNDEEF